MKVASREPEATEGLPAKPRREHEQWEAICETCGGVEGSWAGCAGFKHNHHARTGHKVILRELAASREPLDA